MKRTIRIALIGAFLLLSACAIVLFSYQREAFSGRQVKSEDEYLLDIDMMNGTDLHTMALQKGEALHIRFAVEKGSIHMEIKAPDGTAVYRGNEKGSSEFTVNITESGVYVITVEARHAKGVVHITPAGGRRAVCKMDGAENGGSFRGHG